MQPNRNRRAASPVRREAPDHRSSGHVVGNHGIEQSCACRCWPYEDTAGRHDAEAPAEAGGNGGGSVTPLDDNPMWAIAVGLTVVFVGAAFVGYALGNRHRIKVDGDIETDRSRTVAAEAAMLTLTGFLIAFSYGAAGDHFGDRRQLVIDDAQAIAGTYTDAELIPEPYRSSVQSSLVEYAELRTDFGSVEGTEDFDAFVQRSGQLQDQIVEAGVAGAQADPTPLAAAFINSLDELVDIDDTRTNLRFNRIPPGVFEVLVFLAALAMVLVGYVRGLDRRPALLSAALLIVTYTTVFVLVIDLDRPTQGIFSVSQQPMIDVSEFLTSNQGG